MPHKEKAASFKENSLEWMNWQNGPTHRYAINVNGTLYPVKKIISLATGVAVNDLRGGHPLNRVLQKLRLPIIESLPEGRTPALQFKIGAVYDRPTEINGPFGGSLQNGISVSASHATIFIFSGESGKQFGYDDGWNGGVYFYTGQGQRDDMVLKGGNQAIAEHALDGRTLHLFESLGKSKGYRYEGKFSCADIIEKTLPDVTGKDRKALVFRLMPVGPARSENNEESIVNFADSLSTARLAALAACKPAIEDPKKSAPRTLFQRSHKVAHYVMMRARGKCESCGERAPFVKKDGTPYLEPHHVNRLSDSGLDHPCYVGAVCPTCHREIHYRMDGAIRNDLLKNI
ncbi:HNH endonuclease [Pseudomonas sp. S44]|uniref:HNH endonuclease n=2 Tax=unclassified Pseudomonas TaxID=196821 RepID=UPI00190C616B|nr:HNH endonuclease [Pseudomonas sp. S44]